MARRLIYQPSDAWLLLSVALAGGAKSAELKEVVAAGDYINHAIFTEDELRGGLRRLTAGGWVKLIGGNWAVTSRFKRVSGRLPRTLHKALEQVEEILRDQTEQSIRSGPHTRVRLRLRAR